MKKADLIKFIQDIYTNEVDEIMEKVKTRNYWDLYETPEDYLYCIETNSEEEETIWEQWFLRGIEMILGNVKDNFKEEE